MDGLRFEELVTVGGTGSWAGPAVREAARLVFLLAGISYYKAGVPPVMDLGDVTVRPGEPAFLRSFVVDGLAELGFRNGIEIAPTFIGGNTTAGPPVSIMRDPATSTEQRPRLLVPFGGGLDSIVTVELLKQQVADLSLFIVSRPLDRFEAIENAATKTGLPVVRAQREIDPAVLRSTENGFLNGHVPVTGILSSIALLAAVMEGLEAVVMSNECSASAGSITVNGRIVNHQYSKSAQFENQFRTVLASAFDRPPDYFSLLRPYSELWIAKQFAEHRQYHRTFRSCNRAFYIDPAERLASWCGQCDKCCFIDLVLAPFLAASELDAIFGNKEPLADRALLDKFRALLGLSTAPKPFECVGDVDESRAAAVLAADRPDRRGNEVLATLVADMGDATAAAARRRAPTLLQPMGPTNAPQAYAPSRLLV